MQQLSNENKEILRKLQKSLFKISTKQKHFFNITQYTNLGLIKTKTKYCINSRGEKEACGWDHFLTEKGKRILRANI
jgi:hypothetical protein